MDKKEKDLVPKAINLCGKRRMLSSIKGWEIVKYNNYSNGHTNPQSVKKLRITLSGREVIEYVLNDEDDTIKNLIIILVFYDDKSGYTRTVYRR